MDTRNEIITQYFRWFNSVEEISILVDLIKNATPEEITQAKLIAGFDREASEDMQKRWQERMQRASEEFDNREFYCHFCKQPGKTKDFVRAKGVYASFIRYGYGFFHPDCYQKFVDQVEYEYGAVCAMCGKSVYANKTANFALCNNCATPETKHEYSRWKSQITRARQANVDASLTLADWMKIIKHFNGMCAYCGIKRFTVMEHFIPIGSGGGTSRTNCVPACHHCNTLKRDRLPEELTGVISKRSENVRKWLITAAGDWT